MLGDPLTPFLPSPLPFDPIMGVGLGVFSLFPALRTLGASLVSRWTPCRLRQCLT